MQFSKPRRPLDVATSEAKRFSPFFPQLAKRIQSQGSSYNGLADLLIQFAVSVVERIKTTSKERTGLICVKNQVNFWSLNDLSSLLFIRVQAQAQGNYTEGKRTSTSIDTSRTKRKNFNPFRNYACVELFSR